MYSPYALSHRSQIVRSAGHAGMKGFDNVFQTIWVLTKTESRIIAEGDVFEVLVQGLSGLAALSGSIFRSSTCRHHGQLAMSGSAPLWSSTAQPGRSTSYSAFEVWSLV